MARVETDEAIPAPVPGRGRWADARHLLHSRPDLPEFLSSLTEVVVFGLVLSVFFLMVAIISGIAAVWTRNAHLAKSMAVAMVILLALGGCWMSMMVIMLGQG